MSEQTQTQPEAKAKKKKLIIAIGKRKKSTARATITEGTGKITINSRPLDVIEPRYLQMRLSEPIMIAGDRVNSINIEVNVNGGGVWGQANASRTAIANALVKWTKDNKLKETFVDYDRSLLVSDPRRTEPHKPSRSTAGPRRSKQQSKR